MSDDAGAIILVFVSLAFVIAYSWFWGHVTSRVIENKGYSNNWFWWGFFFGVMAFALAVAKDDYRELTAATGNKEIYDKYTLNNGGWTCTCGMVNAKYVGTCGCGRTKSQVMAERQQ